MKQFQLLCVALALIFAVGRSACIAADVRIGVYGGLGQQGILEGLAGVAGLRAKPLKDFSPASLGRCDVVVWSHGRVAPADRTRPWRVLLTEYVKAGGGLILTHDAVGGGGVRRGDMGRHGIRMKAVTLENVDRSKSAIYMGEGDDPAFTAIFDKNLKAISDENPGPAPGEGYVIKVSNGVAYAANAWALTIYVDKSSGSPVAPYTSGWASAATTIQDAVNAEGTLPGAGHQILVTNGIYDTGFSVVTASGDSLTCRVDVTSSGLGGGEFLYIDSVNGPDVTSIVGKSGFGTDKIRAFHAQDKHRVWVRGFTIEKGGSREEAANDALDRGGINSGNFSNCIFVANDGNRCGLYWWDKDFSYTVVDCVVTGTQDTICIGGPFFYNCTFTGNLWPPRNNWKRLRFENCLFTDFDDFESGMNSMDLINCTVAGTPLNANDFALGAGSTATNCIIYNDTSGGGSNWRATASMTYTLTDPLPPGTGNIATNDPEFVNAGAGNYRLATGSPAIDAGMSVTLGYDTDLDWLPRIYGPAIDLGAYEWTCASAPPLESALDNSLQVVDLTDLDGDLPLAVSTTTQILWQTQDWEHSSFGNTNWPSGGANSVGYPTMVKNVHGLNQDGKYYLYYAHHDPMSGIGCAVADAVMGPYTKATVEHEVLGTNWTDSQVVVNLNYRPASLGGPNPAGVAHFSSPCVVWNEDEQLWFMYFHYFNHYWGGAGDPPGEHWSENNPGLGQQMTAIATCPDLSSHNWTIWTDPAWSPVSVWDIVPVLQTTDELWMESQSSYHAVQRLPDGTWLAFLRGTSDLGAPTVGFGTSTNGRDWTYFAENPVIASGKAWTVPASEYRPKFIGYMGTGVYMVAWAEHSSPNIIYSTTTDFKTFERDARGYATWGVGDGGLVSAWREGDRLYLFSGKNVYEMVLPLQDEDGDGDGMNDDWEEQYFGSTTNSSGGVEEDWDNDGFTDLNEFKAGTDPTNPDSLLVIRDASADSASCLVIKWLSVSNKCYSIRHSTNLTAAWSFSASNLAATPPVNVYTVKVNSAREYFRIGIEN